MKAGYEGYISFQATMIGVFPHWKMQYICMHLCSKLIYLFCYFHSSLDVWLTFCCHCKCHLCVLCDCNPLNGSQLWLVQIKEQLCAHFMQCQGVKVAKSLLSCCDYICSSLLLCLFPASAKQCRAIIMHFFSASREGEHSLFSYLMNTWNILQFTLPRPQCVISCWYIGILNQGSYKLKFNKIARLQKQF